MTPTLWVVLPESSKQPWPPKHWQPFAADIATADSWYSGEIANLTSQRAPSRNWITRAWGKAANGTEVPLTGSTTQVAERRLHVPAAADVAATGADLLFRETPSFTIPEAHAETVLEDAVKAEERLNELIGDDGWSSTLIEGAEICGALGGVFLRPVVAPAIAKRPILTVVHPDVAYPEFSYGHLVAVTFWRTFDGEKGKVWRHLEQYTPGQIENALYCGSVDELGERKYLGDREETAGLITNDADPYGGGIIDTAETYGVDGLLVRYVPNALPNRKHRTQPVGRADTAGCEHLMDALDETWTSWVRDIRLAKARLVVPDEFLDRNGRGSGAAFDQDREVFSPLSMDPGSMERAGITMVQFAIRVDEHERTARALFTQIVQTAGYSPQSFGLQGDGAQQTATEVDAREGRSEATTGRKQEYWRRALEDIGETMLAIDAKVFNSGVTPFRPDVEYAEPETNPLVLAQTLSALSLAGAISTELMVKDQHPEWDQTAIDAEVKRIREDKGLAVADPTGGLAA